MDKVYAKGYTQDLLLIYITAMCSKHVLNPKKRKPYQGVQSRYSTGRNNSIDLIKKESHLLRYFMGVKLVSTGLYEL